MAVIGIINQKGGVGKTTTSVHLAAWLHRQGRPVLLVDADAQRSASAWLKILGENAPPYKAIGEASEILDQVPALAEKFNIVIDGPGALEEVSRAIVLVADAVLVPVQAKGLDLHSTGEIFRVIKQGQRIRGGSPLAMTFLSQSVPKTRLKSEAALLLGELEGVKLLTPAIDQYQSLADAFTQEAVIFDLKGRPAKLLARRYNELFTEVEQWLPANH